MFDVNKLKHTKLTKQEYRKSILDIIKVANNLPIVTIDQVLNQQKLSLEAAKELYCIDSEDGE